MSRASPSRGLARDVRQALSLPRAAVHHTPAWARAFTPTARRPAETKDPFAVLKNVSGNGTRRSTVLENVLGNAPKPSTTTTKTTTTTTTATPQPKPSGDHMKVVCGVMKKVLNTDEFNVSETIGFDEQPPNSDEPWHFHIYSHKHNTHITVSKPNRDAVISVSCGNLGIKKSNRRYYDSAYQLGTYVLDKLYQSPHRKEIKSLEVILRGFGQGRDAVVKVLMGDQGLWLRRTIVRVADSTRLKFGGSRSPKPRRLG